MRTEVEAAIKRFERVSQGITEVVDSISVETRGKLIELRREHATAIQHLSEVVERALNASKNPKVADVAGQFHQRFGEMRRAIAQHQGKWPAVMITAKTGDYVESAQTADAAKTSVITWIKRELVPII